MVIPQYYENPHILHVNTMPNRAYFIGGGEGREGGGVRPSSKEGEG